jgi:hypothetical protein
MCCVAWWLGSRSRSLSVEDGLRAGRPGFYSQHGLRIFLFAIAFIVDLDPTQPPTQWVSWLFPWGQSGRSVILTTNLHSVPKLRLHGVILYLHSPIRLHGVIVKHRDKYTLLYFTLLYFTLLKFGECLPPFTSESSIFMSALCR